jgi:hypothetical protein
VPVFFDDTPLTYTKFSLNPLASAAWQQENAKQWRAEKDFDRFTALYEKTHSYAWIQGKQLICQRPLPRRAISKHMVACKSDELLLISGQSNSRLASIDMANEGCNCSLSEVIMRTKRWSSTQYYMYL